MRSFARILSLTAVIVASLCVTCFAQLSSSQTALGGITLLEPISSVTNTYGTPSQSDKYEIKYGSPATVIIYKTSERIINEGMGGSTTPIVGSIKVTANNGFATPAGITVGMNVSTLENVYGHADKVYPASRAPYTVPKNIDCNEVYIYFGAHAHNFAFYVKNGKIVGILLGLGVGVLG